MYFYLIYFQLQLVNENKTINLSSFQPVNDPREYLLIHIDAMPADEVFVLFI